MARGTTRPSQPLRAIRSARSLLATTKLAARWPPLADPWVSVLVGLPVGCLVSTAWRPYMALAPTPAAKAPRHGELHAAMDLAAKPGRIAKTHGLCHHEHPESSNCTPVLAGQRHLVPRDRAPHVPDLLFWTSWIGPRRIINSVFVISKHGIIGMMFCFAIG